MKERLRRNLTTRRAPIRNVKINFNNFTFYPFKSTEVCYKVISIKALNEELKELKRRYSDDELYDNMMTKRYDKEIPGATYITRDGIRYKYSFFHEKLRPAFNLNRSRHFRRAYLTAGHPFIEQNGEHIGCSFCNYDEPEYWNNSILSCLVEMNSRIPNPHEYWRLANDIVDCFFRKLLFEMDSKLNDKVFTGLIYEAIFHRNTPFDYFENYTREDVENWKKGIFNIHMTIELEPLYECILYYKWYT